MARAKTADAEPAIPVPGEVVPDLEELCRIHELGLEMLDNIDDLDALLTQILDEYEKRLRDIPDSALGLDGEPAGPEGSKQVRALVMFASQATAIKAKAESARQLQLHAEEVERSNERLREALAQREAARLRVDGVLAALDTGVLIVGNDGRIEHANRAAAGLLGGSAESLLERPIGELCGDVPAGGDGELRHEDGPASRVLLVGRRPIPAGGGEVVTLRDVTERDRKVAEQHRLERLDGMFHTLGVLGHKINNPLTALLGRAQMLHMQKGNDPSVGKPATVIVESATRIADLVREMTKVLKEGRAEALEELLDLGRDHDGGQRR